MKKILAIILISTVMIFASGKFQYAEIEVYSSDEIKFLQEHNIDIDRTSFGQGGKLKDGKVTVYISEDQFQMIEKNGYSLKWTPLQISKAGFRFNEAIGDSMLIWQNRWPSICKRIQIGTSVQGRPLWVLKISDNIDIEEAEPELKFVSTMHGDEVTGVEMEMLFIENLLRGYQANNDTMRFIVDNTELYVMPLMNPDGMANNTRYNANGYDLNRNFPEGLYNEPNDPALEEPEIAALINWSNDHNFVLSTNYHGGALVANYGYDIDEGVPNYTYAPAPDDVHLTWLAYNYSLRNQPMFNSSSFTDGITNGSEWYQVTGGMQDWNYRYYNTLDITFEISSTKWPDITTIPGFWADNREAMFWFILAAHKGIYGIVTDSSTGLPIDATIEIAGINKQYNTDPDFGDYYRVLKAGTYSMTVSAPGYYSQTINNIVVTDDTGKFREATEVNVALQQAPRPDITLSVTDTLYSSCMPGGISNEFLTIGNAGTEDLIYEAYVSYPPKFNVTVESNDFESGLIYSDNGTDINWIVISGEAVLNANSGGNPNANSSASLTSGNFDGTLCSSLTLNFDSELISTGGSSISAEYFDGTNWNSVYSESVSGTVTQSVTLPVISSTMRLRFNGTMKNKSGDSWAIDNIQVSGPAVQGSLWLSIDGSDSTSDTVSVSSSDTVTVGFNASGFSYGNYYADIIILSNDPDEPELILPVKLTVTDALSAPSNLIVVNATSSQVDLEWDAVSGATLYRIYRSTDPYSGFAEIGTTGTNGYTDTTVSEGNKYFYYITADNAKK